jgi:hypothetical protein
MPVETTILSEGGVTISTARAVFPTKTYAMSQISSVSMAKVQNTNKFLAGLGILLVIVGLGTLLGQHNILGLIIAVLGGVAFYYSMRTRYAVVITSSAGEGHALVSSDRAQIERVVNAINEAIIQRG